MVEANELVFGRTYFALFYYDEKLLMPDIKTFIFIGRNVDPDETSDYWYFQDPESYLKYGPSVSMPRPKDCTVHRFDKDFLFSIYDWKSLIEELTENEAAQDQGRIFD